MKPSLMTGAIMRTLRANHPAFVWAGPGVGKSQLIREVIAEEMGLPLWDFRTNSKEPVDLRGLPVVTPDGQTTWASPDDLPRTPALFFLDELNTCPVSMQAPLYQIVQDKRLGNWRAHDETRVIAAGNRESDRAVAHKLSTALATRFVHFDMEVDVEDWCKWSITSKAIDPVFIAFIRFRPNLLHDFQPNARTSAVPRTVHMASDVYRQNPPDSTIVDELAGCVGEGWAVEFVSFLRVWRNLPDIDALLRKPDGFVAPSGKDAMSIRFAIAAAVSFKITKDNLANALVILEKLGEEFSVFAMRDAIVRDRSIAVGSKAFARFGAKVADLLG